jgi:hypothetical protein
LNLLTVIICVYNVYQRFFTNISLYLILINKIGFESSYSEEYSKFNTTTMNVGEFMRTLSKAGEFATIVWSIWNQRNGQL